MGRALICDSGAVKMESSAVLSPVAAGQGSTFTVRNGALTSSVQLVDVWRKAAAAGEVRITSPNLVPVSHGIDIKAPTGLADMLLGGPPFQALIPQDTLTVEDLGGDSDIDLVTLQSYYEELPGASMVLKNPGDISGPTEFVFGWPVAVDASATEGNQGSALITTTVDSSSANRWYAVLGYHVDKEIGTVGISGVDTSQLLIGGPGDIAGVRTRNYFADLSVRLGQPCIPLFNAANKGSTSVIAIDNAASTAVNVTLVLAQLISTYTP
jgi:hypothetical protein